nr:MAG TPA: minor tail protein [Caudoviricetes sp.]
MSEVSAISGATGADLDALTQKAKEMGASTKFSASESAEAFKYMAMAGWETSDMLDGISGVMNLAAASGEDLGEVSDIVTDAITAFGLQASDSAHFADVLAAASNSANTNVSMLGGSFKYVAPVAGALGYSIEDVSVALGMMANSGIKAEMAGRSLRAMLSRLASPTKDVEEAFAQLGLSASEALTNADGSMKPLSETIEILRGSMSGLDEATKASVASGIAGTEAMSGLLAIVNSSDADFEKLTEAIANADGTAQRMADTMNDNLKGAITIMKSAVEGFGISLYETFSVKAKDGVKTLTDYISRLQKAFDAGGMQGLLTEFDSVMTDALGVVTEYLPKIISVGGSVVGSLANGIIQNLPALVDAASEIIINFVDNVTEKAGDIVSSGSTIVTDLADGISKFVEKLYPAVTKLSYTLAEKLSDPSTLSALLDSAIEIILALVNGIMEALPIIVQSAPVIIGNLVAGLIVALPKIIDAGIEILMSLVNGILDTIPSLVAAIPTITIAIVNGILNNLDEIILAAIQITMSIAMGMIEAIPNMITQLPRIFLAIVNAFKEFNWKNIGTNLLEGIWNGINDKVAWLKGKVQGVVDKIKGWFTGEDGFDEHSPSKWSKKVFQYVMDGGVNGIDAGMPGMMSAVSGAVDSIKSGFDIGAVSANASASGSAQSNVRAVIHDEISKMGIYLDGNILVGGISDRMNQGLGSIYVGNERRAMA